MGLLPSAALTRRRDVRGSHGALLLRLCLGVILLDHGLGKLVGWDPWPRRGSGLAAVWSHHLLPWLFVSAAVLLVLGLFTYAATLVAALGLLGFHLDVLMDAASRLHMWSNLVFIGAASTLLWLAPADRWGAARWLPQGGYPGLAQRGPAHYGPRLDVVVLLLRLALGCDFMAAGGSKLHYPWAAGTVAQFQATVLPELWVRLFASALPSLQIVLGAAVAGGFLTAISTLALGGTMLCLIVGQLALGASLLSLWSMFIYLLVLVFVLCLPAPNRFSLDGVLAAARAWHRRRRAS